MDKDKIHDGNLKKLNDKESTDIKDLNDKEKIDIKGLHDKDSAHDR